MFIEPNKIIFKQDHAGIFRNKNHSLIVVDRSTFNDYLPATEIIDTSTGGMVYSGFYSDAIVALADTLKVEWDDICMLTYMAQKGRHSDMEVKIGPGHLTKGTKFKADGLPGKKHSGRILTVKEVQPNGPGSMVVICEEMETDPFGKNGELVNIGFHIDFVSSIVRRAPEQGPGWKTEGFNPQMSDTESEISRRLAMTSFVPILQRVERDNTSMWRRDVDVEKLVKRLRGMGIASGRRIDIEGIRRVRGLHPYLDVQYVDAKRALKFLRKNPHWAFGTIEAARLKDAEYWDEVHSQLDDIIGRD